eukprot:CAMPEP_0184305200 /NCGR_PEP_ID=MMETSP1049-20130417/14527_1 /TAXON_ID=77928 /ORGANISM="Proteomonas sulcata, Strain CCMP704" /LENGTH=139 /DNA_ID=CAMNT_0026617205 /DNA_START=140 /DNA_END=559 /DNA_ORIENTATION=-
MDALHEDADKVAMLTESLRIVRETGFVITVSFATPARKEFLERFCSSGGLPKPRMWVIGKDPLFKVTNPNFNSKDGPASNYFVTVITKSSRSFTSIEYKLDEFSRSMISRLEKSGSLYHEGDSDDEELLAEGLLTDEIL